MLLLRTPKPSSVPPFLRPPAPATPSGRCSNTGLETASRQSARRIAVPTRIPKKVRHDSVRHGDALVSAWTFSDSPGKRRNIGDCEVRGKCAKLSRAVGVSHLSDFLFVFSFTFDIFGTLYTKSFGLSAIAAGMDPVVFRSGFSHRNRM